MIEAQTKYTKESVLKFQRFHLFSRGGNGLILKICMAVILAVAVLTLVVSVINMDFSYVATSINLKFLRSVL